MDDLVLQDVQVKVCDICAEIGREDLLASCSRCSDGAEHTYCMREIMDKFPSGDWLCEECQFGVQIKGRNEETLDIEASTKMISYGQANSGGNSRNKKLLVKVFDENRVINGPTANILGERQTEDVEVSQGSMSFPFNKSSALQEGDKGISGGSIGCPAFETRNPELTNLSFGGKTTAYGHMEEKGPNESKGIPVSCIPDLNSTPLEQDTANFAGERLFFPVVPIADKEVELKSSESKALNLELCSWATKNELSLNLEAEEAATTKGGKDELSLSLSLPFPGAASTHPTF